MTSGDSRRSLTGGEWEAPDGTDEPGRAAGAGGEEYVERFSQPVRDRLTYALYVGNLCQFD